MKRKLAAIVLAIAMVFTMMPVTSFSVAYADEGDLNYWFTDTELQWEPVEGAESYQLSYRDTYFDPYDGSGPDFYESSFYRSIIDKTIRSKVFNRYPGYEEQESYTLTLSAAAADGGVLGHYDIVYPSPIDHTIRNVRIDGDYLYWDEYSASYYYVYVNGVLLGQGYEEGEDLYGIDLSYELDSEIESGNIQKPEDNVYTFKIENIAQYDDGEQLLATWEGDLTYETDAENPYFEEAFIDENGNLEWYAPYSNYVDLYIDGVRVHEISNYPYLNEIIDRLVESGKISSDVSNHEIVLKAYRYDEEGGGPDIFLCEWTGTYEYTSGAELITEFPDVEVDDYNGLVTWNYFKDVDHFRYSINEYTNENYNGNSLWVHDEIDSLIESNELKKDENDGYYLLLEAIDEEGNVLDSFDHMFTYETSAVGSGDELYYLEVINADSYGADLTWNRVNRASRYGLYINDVTISEDIWENYYSTIKEVIDRLLRNGGLTKPADNKYTITVKALEWTSGEDDEEYLYPFSEKELIFEYDPDAEPLKDYFDSVDLCSDEYDDHYGVLSWNEIRGADLYKVTVGNRTEWCEENEFDLFDFIDSCIENGYVEKSDEYSVTIGAYINNSEDGELIDTFSDTYAYESNVEVLGTDFGELVFNKEYTIEWNKIRGAEYYEYTLDGYTGRTEYNWISADNVLFDLITEGAIVKSDEHTFVVRAYDDDGELIATSDTLNFTHVSMAKEPADSLVDVEFRFDEQYGSPSIDLAWNPVINASFYRYTVNGSYSETTDNTRTPISSIIDNWIGNAYIEKTGTYTIMLEALDDDGYRIGDAWTDALVYDSYAEPYPENFVIEYFEKNSLSGYLRWKPIRNADYYTMTVQGVTKKLFGVSLDLYDEIEAMIYSGDIVKQSSYEVLFNAYKVSGEYEVDNTVLPGVEMTLTVSFNTEAVPPADTFLDGAVKLQENRSGRLIWNYVNGADYYIVTIDEYSYEEYLNYAYIYDDIDNFVRDGYIPDITNHEIKVEAYKAESPYGEPGNNDELLAEWTGTCSYKAAQQVDIFIDPDGTLSVKYKDGSEVEGFNDGYIKINDNIWVYVQELPCNIKELIDDEIETNKDFQKTGTYDLFLNGYNSNGRTCIYGDYEGYEYDSPATYIEPKEMTPVQNGEMVVWDAIEGAVEYVIMVAGSDIGYSTQDTQYDVGLMIDTFIAEGYIEKSSDGIYRISVDAYNDRRANRGHGTVDFRYDSQAELAKQLDVTLSEDGTITWVPIEGIKNYEVGIRGYFWGVGDSNTANIHRIINVAVDLGYGNEDNLYELYVLAYDERGVLLARWELSNYYYVHVHDSNGATTVYPATKTENGWADGIIYYSCSECGAIVDDKAILAPETIELEKTSYTYDGKVKNPAVTIADRKGNKLVEGTDYEVTYASGCKNVGTYDVTVTFKGNYSGTETLSFKINAASQSITAKAEATSVAVGKTTKITVTGAKGSVSYKSADTAIATVSSTGTITAKKVGTVKITVTSAATTNYNKATKTVTIKVVPAATSSLTAANQATGIKLTWKKVTGATGYKVYRGSTLLKKITSGSTVTYTDTKANTNGTKYTFKVVPYASTGDGTAKSLTTYRVSRPAISSVKNSAAKKATVKWGKNTKATGYEIWYSTSKSFSSKKTATVTKNSTVSKTLSSLIKGKTYYVKIRSYKTVSGKKYYSAWSTVKTVKITK